MFNIGGIARCYIGLYLMLKKTEMLIEFPSFGVSVREVLLNLPKFNSHFQQNLMEIGLQPGNKVFCLWVQTRVQSIGDIHP